MGLGGFTGVGALTRVAFRRDRLQLSIWVVVLAGMLSAFTAAFQNVLPSEADITVATRFFTANPGMRLFALPSEPSLGAFVMLRVYTMFAVLAGLMTVFAVVRHTRQDEDAGRTEVVRAGVVGRHASLAAALIVALTVNVALSVLSGLGLVLRGLDANSAFLVGVAIGGAGLVFGGIAAITAQIAPTARGATGLATTAIGAAFLLAGVGNMLGHVEADGLRVTSAWPAWLSPIGWGQQLRPFAGDHWGVAALFLASFAVTAAVALALEARRDVGRGLLPESRGPARAARGLLSPFGLVWRLQRGLLFGWIAGLSALVLVMGLIAGQVEQLMSDVAAAEELLTRLGGSDVMLQAYFATIWRLLGAVVAVFVLQSLLRLRAEESAGPLESILATAVGRRRWAFSLIVNTVLSTAALLFIAGATFGVAAGIALDDVPHWLWRLTAAALVQAPAAFVVGAVAVVAFGWAPRWTSPAAWLAFAAAFILGPLVGALLDLPQRMLDLSPFTHTPMAPAEPISPVPVLVLCAVAIALGVLGLLGFDRRDLAPQSGG